MSCYENLVMKTQMNYSGHYSTYASGGTAVVLSKQKPLSYEEQIQEFVRRVQEAECIVVGGASGLSAAESERRYRLRPPIGLRLYHQRQEDRRRNVNDRTAAEDRRSVFKRYPDGEDQRIFVIENFF